MEISDGKSVCDIEDSSQSYCLTPSALDGNAFRFSSVVDADTVAEKMAKKILKTSDDIPVANLVDRQIMDDVKSQGTQEKSDIGGEKTVKKLESVMTECVQEIKMDKGDIFEKLIFCKGKVVSSQSKTQKFKTQSHMRKSFWLYPINQEMPSADLKEEAEILTSFFFDQPLIPRIKESSSNPLAFISDFFANYKSDQCLTCTFMLNKNVKQDEYSNIYNPQGNRYFIACIFDDFEDPQKNNQNNAQQAQIPSLELSKTLFLIESRYPFRHFFSSMLTRVFNIVRVRRLEKYSINYNGNERDRNNLAHIKNYDARTILGVISNDLDTE